METIEQISRNPDYKDFDFIAEIVELSDDNYNIHEIWEQSVEKSLILGKDEAEIMLSFGNMLGTSDISGQLSSIEIYKKRLEFLLSGLRKDYESKGKMYRSLGLLLGIMTGIVLL